MKTVFVEFRVMPIRVTTLPSTTQPVSLLPFQIFSLFVINKPGVLEPLHTLL